MNPQKQQELNDNLDFLRGQFDTLNAQIKLPHSLGADMLRYKLEHIDLLDGAKSPPKRVWLRPLLGMAACFVVVLGSFFALRSTGGDQLLDSAAPRSVAVAPAAFSAAPASPVPASLAPNEGGQGGEQAIYADSYTALRDEVYRMNGGADYYSTATDQQDGYSNEIVTGGAAGASAAAAAANDLAMPEAVMESPTPQTSKAIQNSAGGARFSATNTQESGVDEADIVKTDGRYLYSYVAQNVTSQYPTIFIADATTMALTSKIELTDANVTAFYIADNRLVTVGGDYSDLVYRNMQTRETIVDATDDTILRGIERTSVADPNSNRISSDYARSAATVTVYDISDRTTPKQVKSFAQDGDYTSSRMLNDTLYLVSNHYVSPALDNRAAPLAELVPAVYDGTAARVLPANRIAIAPNSSSACYAVVSTLNVKTGVSDTQAVLGGSDGVYMSADNLYVYYGGYREQATDGQSIYASSIVRFDAGDKLTLGKTAVVDGMIDGQFSLSEKDGNLRVATTIEPLSGETSSRVTVLDRQMKQIGLLQNLAPGERIYAARYVGSMVYLVTFRQTDPLFAIDLSDPKNPKLLGQLKIPGFSEYLHPIDDKTLLGIGRAADANGTVSGLKLSLFDVSDPLKPKELSVYNLGAQGSWSEALDNHKAVMFNAARSMFAFPAQVQKANDSMEEAYFVFTYDKTKGFTLEQAITHAPSDPYSAFNTVRRGLYIGDTLYTFSSEKIVSFGLDTLLEKQSLRLK